MNVSTCTDTATMAASLSLNIKVPGLPFSQRKTIGQPNKIIACFAEVWVHMATAQHILEARVNAITMPTDNNTRAGYMTIL